MTQAKMTEYRKKPLVVEAVQILDSNQGEIIAFMENTGCGFEAMSRNLIIIHTLEGDMSASIGDWIIKGIKGEVYPCRPDIFEATYTRVESTNPEIVDQWSVIDKWWTDTPEKRVYLEFTVDEQKCTVQYDQETKMFTIVGADGVCL